MSSNNERRTLLRNDSINSVRAQRRPLPQTRRFNAICIALFTSVFILAIFYFTQVKDLEEELAATLMVDDIYNHLHQLYKIARENGDNRAIGPGFDASAKYVYKQLEKYTPCKLHRQYFKVPVWEEITTTQLGFQATPTDTINFINERDFILLRYSGSPNMDHSDVPVQAIDDNLACHHSGYRKLSGHAILLNYPLVNKSCTMESVAFTAEKAKAVALLFRYNRPVISLSRLPNPRTINPDWREGDQLVKIPALMISNTTANIVNQGKICLNGYAKTEVVETSNIICLWGPIHSRQPGGVSGAHNRTIIVGSHLDSVPKGPGMVDNGSGSSATLAIAQSFAHINFAPRNRLVFAWWGAEEIGLFGSRYFVRHLDDPENGVPGISKDQVVANLNFDMLGSPNWVPYVHDGETAPDSVKSGSKAIQRVFESWFLRQGILPETSDLYGGSDFLPFLLADIPAGGLLTGAGSLKTAQDRRKHGGLANTPFDPCYHLSCDTPDNVSLEALDKMSHAAMHGIVYLSEHKNLLRLLQPEE